MVVGVFQEANPVGVSKGALCFLASASWLLSGIGCIDTYNYSVMEGAGNIFLFA